MAAMVRKVRGVRLGEDATTAIAFWRKAARPEPTALAPKDFLRFRKQVLHPAFGLVETLSGKMGTDRAGVARQTDEQVETCLRDRDESPLAVFYDPAQKIFDRNWELLERAAQHELRVNFRNTRSIARAVSDVGGVQYRFLGGAPEGEPVTFAMDVKKGAQTRDKVDDIVRRLVETQRFAPDDIVVLTAHRSGNSLGVKTLGVRVATTLAGARGRCSIRPSARSRGSRATW